MPRMDMMSLAAKDAQKPEYGRAIAARRAYLGKSALDIENIYGSALYQKLIYRLENGKKHPLSLDLAGFAALLEALEWTTKEFEAATGLNVPEALKGGFETMPNVAPAATGGATAMHYGFVSAGKNGNGNSIKPHPVTIPTWISDRYNPDDIFVLTVVGDSMTCEDVRKNIPEGSEVYFHKSLRPERGEIIAVWLDAHDFGVIKIYKPQREFTVLESYNRSHKPITIDESNPGTVQGVYIGKSEPSPCCPTNRYVKYPRLKRVGL